MEAPSQTAQSPSAVQNPPPAAPAPASPGPAPASPAASARGHAVAVIGGVTLALILGIVVLVFGWRWMNYRWRHSITEDAFIEAHIVNIAAQSVSGHLVRYLVEENDRVEQGQLLAEIDPIPYRDQVEVARSKVETAEAELRRQEAALERLKLEVPLQVEIAKRTLSASLTEHAKAEKSLELTTDDVEKGIDEAQAGLEASKADLVLAEQEFSRFTNLFKEDAVALRRSQEVTRSRDAAFAHRKAAEAKLAKAESAKLKIDVSTRDVEASETAKQKARASVDLAETGYAQIHEVELLTVVKRESVKEARRALTTAENQLEYTHLRAPFPAVVVKRYRHLGDFASAGVPVLSLYNPELLYVTANLEETRLTGVAPGNFVDLEIDAFAKPFIGRVVWINKSTGAQFALMPRNVVSGEFTKVVQRVPVRIQIEKDDRWPLLRAGLSLRLAIAHGPGDPEWTDRAAREMIEIETRYNQSRE
jgi:membrane fusion protein (multidrug efflux system)